MKIKTIHLLKLTRPRTILSLAALLCGLLAGCRSPQVQTPSASQPRIFQEKLPSPREFNLNARTHGVFEKQFQADIGETNALLLSVFEKNLTVKGQSEDVLLLNFDLSEWPESSRREAHLWVCIGASNAFTTEVNVNLNFSQNGTGVTAPLNNQIAIDDMALVGCDFAMQDGEVTVKIENSGMPRDVDYTLHAIAYLPRKPGQ
ncbi:MAG: hypothetical protein H7Y43_12640 [Akkermansiaceae bacterium]|nr:hypothetical protein [Verrucomicrobiales bacterium]